MPDQFQYVKLPDGSYGKFAANATDAQIRAALSKDFPDAFQQDLKTGKGMLPGEGGPVDRPKVEMQTSAAPSIVRAATSTLPAVGALTGGLLSSPGIVTSAAGAGLGAAAGKQGELLANHFIFGPEETNPASARGLIKTGEEGLSYAVPTAAIEVGTRALLGQPLETGLRMAPPFTEEELNAQRAANRAGEEKLAQFMSGGYKPAEEAELSQSIRAGRAARLPVRIASPASSGSPWNMTVEAPERQAAIPSISAPTPLDEFAARQNAARTAKAAEIAPPESIKGSVGKPSGRLVLTPEESAANEQMQRIATQRAREHGMQYAAGMRPAGGGKVPLTPTGTNTFQYPDAQDFRDMLQHIAAPEEYSRPLISAPDEEENPRGLAAD